VQTLPIHQQVPLGLHVAAWLLLPLSEHQIVRRDLAQRIGGEFARRGFLSLRVFASCNEAQQFLGFTARLVGCPCAMPTKGDEALTAVDAILDYIDRIA
jgi:hypothetical protein